MGDSQSLNRYNYVNNNPINFVDPSGHARIENSGGGGNATLIKKNSIPTNYVAQKQLARAEAREKANTQTTTDNSTAPLTEDLPPLVNLVINLPVE